MLLRAVKSCLNQTFPVHEILVCDDGSTDDSRRKIGELNDPRVKWLDCGRNGRPAVPRNIGIKKSSGNWVAFLDNDDEWLPEKLETQVMLAEEFDIHFICTNAYRIEADENKGAFFTAKPSQVLNFYGLVVSNSIICSSVLIRKEILLKYSFFPEEPNLKALEDYAFWLKISTHYNIYFTSECLLNYNDNESTSIRKGSLTTQQQMALVCHSFKQWVKKNPGMVEDYMVSVAEHLLVLRYLKGFRKLLYKLSN
jgi:teichuronic acid biosynthesis glycosyltransferase TuaG